MKQPLNPVNPLIMSIMVAGNSWCSDNNEANCKKYGRLYDWKTAVKACPSGWHLPKMAECGTPYGLGINYDANTVNELIGNKGNGWSVRCVQGEA